MASHIWLGDQSDYNFELPYYDIFDYSKNNLKFNSQRISTKMIRSNPYPLGLWLEKYSNINKLTTAGLDSVAVRFPKHKVLRKILRKINFPLAMPSANKSGKVSPTCAKHV